jgi:hypothetical protein
MHPQTRQTNMMNAMAPIRCMRNVYNEFFRFRLMAWKAKRVMMQRLVTVRLIMTGSEIQKWSTSVMSLSRLNNL